jgi:amino acid transporter
MKIQASKNNTSPSTKFGTFGGVFTPCTLTILGVIMFLRFGQVTGQAGILQVLLIILCAKGITTLTAFSLSAIATNTRVKGGGAYYLISRSLGVEFGGAIGVFFFLAQAISVSMYVVGFTEAFFIAFPNPGWSFRTVATSVNIVVFVCVYIGAGWTIRVQYGILAVLILAIGSFVAGAAADASWHRLSSSMLPAYRPGDSFFTMFALFFPAVTGIMAGANMSGDLRDPGRSIPSGTLSAIAFTGVIYLGMAVLMCASRDQEVLITDPFVVKAIAWSPLLINAGVFAATLSSALGSMMGAPRILQAFARDDILKGIKIFGQGHGKNNEPRLATVLTFLIAQAGILLGDLNAIAPIITMFFMITYGTLNLACFYESITHNPSYRPRFRLSHWSTAILGALGCLAVMFLMNPIWALVAVAAMAALYGFISRSEIISRWGDVTSGVAFERARKALLKLEDEKYHPKNWRPSILALSGGAWKRYHIAEYAYWLAAGRGVLTLGHILTGDVEDRFTQREQAEKQLRKFIHDEILAAFPVVIVEEDLSEAIKALLQCHGIGGVRPNTVLLGWSHDPDRQVAFCETLRLSQRFQRSILIVKCDEEKERWVAPAGSVDIWWRGPEHGALSLLLAHLLVQSHEWRRRPIRILCTVPPKADSDNMALELRALLDTARIDASVHVFITNDPLWEIAKQTGQSAVLFADFTPPDEGHEAEFIAAATPLMQIPIELILVYNSGGVSLEA